MYRVLLASIVLAGLAFPGPSHAAVGSKDPNIGFGIVDYEFHQGGTSCTTSPATVVVSQDPMGGWAIASQVVLGTTDPAQSCFFAVPIQLIGNTADAVGALAANVPIGPPIVSADLGPWTLTGTPETGFHARSDAGGGVFFVLDLGPLGPATSIRWAKENVAGFTYESYTGTISFVR